MGANQFIPIPVPNPTFLSFVDPNLRVIANVSNAASAIVTTSTPHGLLAGDVAVIRGVQGLQGAAPSVNGLFVVTAPVLANSFAILSDTSLATPYVPGTGQTAKAGKRRISNVIPGTPLEIETADETGTPIFHNLTTGDTVRIDGVLGIPNANGVWIVTVTSPTTFTLDGSSGFGVYTPFTGIVSEGPFPVVIETAVPHGYATGAVVDVRANSAFPGQLFEITVLSLTQFSLDLEGEDIQFPLGGIVSEIIAAPVDLAFEVPPNGVEKRKTFSLAGDYSGRVIFEGSMDNDLYSPFLLFNEGKPGGIKVVEVNVPFIRVRVENLIINSGSLVAFMAAEQNCDCDLASPDHGANFYDSLDVPDPTELDLDREDPIGIVSTSFATPIVVETSSPHPYVTGDDVRVTDVVDGSNVPLVSANGVWTITVIDEFHFSLDTSVGTAPGFGGSVSIITAPNTTPIGLTTAVPHGYFTGDTVRVRGVVDPETPFSIISAFSPNSLTPILITTVLPHGYTTGNRVSITGNTDGGANGDFTITVTGVDTFTLDGTFGPVSGSGGSSLRFPGADGDFVITVTGPTTFTLDGSIGTGDGTGGTVQAIASAATPTDTLKSEKTLQLQGGPYTGAFVIDGTLDPGIDPVFLPFDQFNTGGADEKLEMDALFFSMRVRPEGAEGDVTIWVGSQLTCDCLEPPPLGIESSGPAKRPSGTKASAPKTSGKSKTERAAAKARRKRS